MSNEKVIVDQEDEEYRILCNFSEKIIREVFGNVVSFDTYLLKIVSVGEDKIWIAIDNSISLRSKTCSVLEYDDLVDVVEKLGGKGIEIDMIYVNMMRTPYLVILNGVPEEEPQSIGYFIRNRETGKIYLHFNKESYMELDDSSKSLVKSNFLFSRKTGTWVSRAKFPNTRRAVSVAEKLGLENRGVEGETLTFAEQMERKAERAERRAERYEGYAENARAKGESLQSGFNEASQDIAFVTQPNINSSAGRSFTNYRNRLLRSYEKGFEEFKKSEYYKDKAEAARSTADFTKPTSKVFCIRRIDEAEKDIRAKQKNLDIFMKRLDRLNNGETLHYLDGTEVSIESVQNSIDETLEILDGLISKRVYYEECLADLGGVEFSKDNIKVGYIVNINRYGKVKVTSTGPKNISYVILEGGASGLGGKCEYAAITEVLDTELAEIKDVHPFKVGEVYSVKEWDGSSYVDVEYKIVGITDKSVKIQKGNEKPILRKPRKRLLSRDTDDYTWEVWVDPQSYKSMFSKKQV